ncbi:lamin tail domain-containing protein [candidate division KSB1 bacterium]|nr:lamin tail domain-containing protein [candidate division KSB1 bacterium]
MKHIRYSVWIVFPVFLQAQVFLNEVMFNPSGPESSDEFVEILNASTGTVDLTGWQIGDGSDSDFLSTAGEGLFLAPGQYALILDPDYFDNSTTYEDLIPPECLICTLDGSTFGSGGFSNSQAEKVTLLDDSGSEVDQHAYSIQTPAGYSEERVEDASSPEYNLWKGSSSENGTPGGANSVSIIPVSFEKYTLIINEIMSDPIVGEPEWFEIYNRSSETINLNGWMFSDSDTIEIIPFCSEERSINAGAYAVISEDSSLLNSMLAGSDLLFVPSIWPSLNNGEDVIHLGDPSGQWIDQVAYEASWQAIPNTSLERISPEGGSSDSTNWYSCTTPSGMTPGEANSVYASFIPTNSQITVTPDPFSPDGDGFEDVAVITFHIATETASVRLQIYDISGRLIRTLIGGGSSGSQGQILWDGKDENGKIASIGVYIVYLSSLNARQAVQSEARTTLVLAGRL